MEKVSTMPKGPPPLPPKTKRCLNTTTASLIETTSPVTATVISTSSANERCNNSSSGTDDESTILVSSFQRQQSSSVSPHTEKHVVKIRINPGEDAITPYHTDNSFQSKIQVVQQQQQQHFPYSSNNSGCIRININEENMIRSDNNYMKVAQDRPNPYFFYGAPNGIISSGQSSPSDTLDSGTCSDLDGSTPPPLPKKQSSSAIRVTVNGNHHKRNCSVTSSGIDADSDDEGSNISCDSLNSHELNGVIRLVDNVDISSVVDVERQSPEAGGASDVQEDVITPLVCTPVPPPPPQKSYNKQISTESITSTLLPDGLLQDIREHTGTGDTVTMLIKKKSTGHMPYIRNDRKVHQFINTNVQIIEKEEDTSVTPMLVCVENPNLRMNSPVFSSYEESLKSSLVQERTYEDRKKENDTKEKENADREKEAVENKLNSKKSYIKYDEDKFYKFHLNENYGAEGETVKIINEVDESFAGYKDYLDNNRSTSSTIKSAKGTVRGVKNRVRAGIATFLQVHTEKNYKEKEVGKVIVYTTTMGVVRATFHDCLKVKQILRTLMVKYEERDVMSREVQAEIRDRMSSADIVLPQLFVEGQHIGDAETVERLNETGELRRILKPFKSADACTTCPVCGGYRLLPCTMCNGSKKSVHRNEFTAEFIALKCMKCDEVGLIKCYAC